MKFMPGMPGSTGFIVHSAIFQKGDEFSVQRAKGTHYARNHIQPISISKL